MKVVTQLSMLPYISGNQVRCRKILQPFFVCFFILIQGCLLTKSISAAEKSPTAVVDMPHKSIVLIQHEHKAPRIEQKPWNAQDFSVSDQWKSQQVDVIEGSDSALSSVHANVDSSDDGSDIYDYNTPNVLAGQSPANEMTSAPE
jgi:hypothetical protein